MYALATRVRRALADAKPVVATVLATALCSQFLAVAVAQAAVIPDNEVGTQMTGFRLDNNAVFSQDLSGQQAGAGGFANGSIADYPEGSCIPSLVEVENKDNQDGDIVIGLDFDYLNGAIGVDHLETVTSSLGADVGDAADLGDLMYALTDFSSATSFTTQSGGSVMAAVTGPTADGMNGQTELRRYGITLFDVPEGEIVNVIFCARLGDDANEFNGAQMSVRLEGGSENIGIQASNLLVLPSLTLVKEIVGGGPLSPDAWSFNVSPAINGQNTFATTLNPDDTASVTIENVPVDGAYVITESGPAGASSYLVSGGAGGQNCVFSGATATASLAAGDPATDATCVFVNTYDMPATALTVHKEIINNNGGTATLDDFRFFVYEAPGGVVDVLSYVEVFPDEPNVFAPGTYWVSEQGDNGYYIASFADDCNAGGFVTLGEGEQLTCTMINDDQQGGVTVNKVVNGGPLTADQFELFVGAEEVMNGVTEYFDSGTTTVSETPVPGYVASFSGNCDADGNIFVQSGFTRTCTITNTYVDPNAGTGTITVIKEVDGGPAQVSDFPLFVGAESVTSGIAETFAAGVYTVTETNNQANYTAAYSGDCDASGEILLGVGQNLTCTITNTYTFVAPPTGTVTVTKVVIGGNAQVGDFDLFVGQTHVISGATNSFPIGTYSVAESGPTAGYTAAYSGDCATGNVMVADGGSYNCTITNTAIPGEEEEEPVGTLTVVKVVINNDSGTMQPSDFSLFVNQTSVTTGQTLTLPAGSYTVSETNTPGYVGSFSGGCDASGIVSIADGDEKICTITNDDMAVAPPGGSGPIQGFLTIVTNVINDDGGIALAPDFLLHVEASPSSGVSGMAAPGSTMALSPGLYAVQAPAAANYVMSQSPACSGTIAANQSVLCVVTYDDVSTVPPSGGGFVPLPPTPPAPPSPPAPPAPQVLGTTDSATDTGPVPQVLGATDEQLPVTGVPAWVLAAVLATAFAATRRQK